MGGDVKDAVKMLGMGLSVSGTFASNMLVFPTVDVAGCGEVRAFVKLEGVVSSTFAETGVGIDRSIDPTATIVGIIGAEVVLGCVSGVSAAGVAIDSFFDRFVFLRFDAVLPSPA